jgi:hypothetical protein
MFQNDNFARVRRLFADQFDSDGTRIVYRKNLKGTPIEVSGDERDHLIKQFNRRLRYMIVALFAGLIILLIGSSVLLFLNFEAMSSRFAGFAIVAILLVPFMAGYMWAWNGPARMLAGRPALGEARSKTEMRRMALQRLTWGRLGALAASAVIPLMRINWHQSLWSGWNLLGTLLLISLLAVVTIQSVRKLLVR